MNCNECQNEIQPYASSALAGFTASAPAPEGASAESVGLDKAIQKYQQEVGGSYSDARQKVMQHKHRAEAQGHKFVTDANGFHVCTRPAAPVAQYAMVAEAPSKRFCKTCNTYDYSLTNVSLAEMAAKVPRVQGASDESYRRDLLVRQHMEKHPGMDYTAAYKEVSLRLREAQLQGGEHVCK